MTLEQATNDAAVKFLVPRALPDGAKLTTIFRVPTQNENATISKETIAQRYDINGKYLEIWATPKVKAPDYKRIADGGTVKVPEQNPDGSIRMQTDGSIKEFVRTIQSLSLSMVWPALLVSPTGLRILVETLLITPECYIGRQTAQSTRCGALICQSPSC